MVLLIAVRLPPTSCQKPPPLPSAEFPLIVLSVTVTRLIPARMPPPSRSAELSLIVVWFTVTLPSRLKMPPPELKLGRPNGRSCR